jgi:hypothetical protein
LLACILSLSVCLPAAADPKRPKAVTYTYGTVRRPVHPEALDPKKEILTDKQTNPGHWSEGGWAGVLGEKGSPLEITFDLGEWRNVDSIQLHYLHDPEAGITAPSRLSLGFAVEGRKVGEPIGFKAIPVSGMGIQSVTAPSGGRTGRYVTLTVWNWRGGWTFLSEVSFKSRRWRPPARSGR